MAGHHDALTYQAVSLEMVHLLSELCKSGSVISTIRPVIGGGCIGGENTRREGMTNGNIFPVEAQIILVTPSSRPAQHMSIVTCG